MGLRDIFASDCALLAHRGGRALGPENSPEVVMLAGIAGADAVEIDVHECRDGTLVATHSAALGFGSTPVWLADTEYALARQLWADADIGLFLLDDVLDAAFLAHLGVYLDVKQLGAGGITRLGESATHTGCASRTVVASAHTDIVEAAASAGWLASWLVRDRWTDPLAIVARTGASMVHPCFDAPRHELEWAPLWFRRVRDAGLDIVAWTVDTQAAFDELASWGASAICVDDPRIIERPRDPSA